MQMEMEKIRLQNEAKLAEIRMNLELQASNDARDRETDQINAQLRAELDAAKMQNDEQIAQLQAQLDRYKTDADNHTRIQVALIQQQGKAEQAAMQAAFQSQARAEQPGVNE